MDSHIKDVPSALVPFTARELTVSSSSMGQPSLGQMWRSEGPGLDYFLFPVTREAPCWGCRPECVICLRFLFQNVLIFSYTFNILLFLVDEERKACSEKCITTASPEEIHPGAVFTASAANFKNNGPDIFRNQIFLFVLWWVESTFLIKL